MTESEVLFSITKDHLDTGLRGVPVGYVTTSVVEPMKGLFYRGYPVEKLAYNDPEEVIYLLFNGELPTPDQLSEFKNMIASHSGLNPEVIEHLKTLPKSGHPMKWFVSGINMMGMVSGTGDYRKDAWNVISQVPELVAAIYRIRSGWGDPIAPKPELGYMENFAHMLNPPNASKHLLKLMRVFDILHFDHGGGNLSTFVGKAVASGLQDMYGSLAGAMLALGGPLHGMANQECLEFLKEALENVSDPTDEKAVDDYLEDLFKKGKKIYGFGHAVLRVEDPRAIVEYNLGEEICPDDRIFRMAASMRKCGSEFLKKQGKVADPFPNVDAVSGSLLNACGLSDSNYYVVLFGLSRVVGIGAQIVHDRLVARGGKGTPIIRPKYIYTGPKRD